MRLSYKSMASRKIISSFVRPWGLTVPGIRERQEGKIRSCRPHPLERGMNHEIRWNKKFLRGGGGQSHGGKPGLSPFLACQDSDRAVAPRRPADGHSRR